MFNFDEMLNDLCRLIMQAADGEHTTTGKIPISKKSHLDLSYNFSVRVGLPQTSGGAFTQDKFEPLIDVFDKGQTLRILALLPGVQENDINFEVKDNSILITVTKGAQTYQREITCNVKPANVSTTFRNGVLEIVFRKREGGYIHEQR